MGVVNLWSRSGREVFVYLVFFSRNLFSSPTRLVCQLLLYDDTECLGFLCLFVCVQRGGLSLGVSVQVVGC